MVNLCIVLLCIKEFVRCILYSTCKCILRGRRRGGRGGDCSPTFESEGAQPPHFFTSLLLNVYLREIGKLMKYSPKRSHLFSQKLAEADSDSVVTVKSLCTTRWTARTSAIDAVLKDYSILMETTSEVNATTRDEYGLKAGRIVAALEKFSTLFGLRLGFLLFAIAEDPK